MSAALANGLIVSGASLLYLDYLDRRFLFTKDLQLCLQAMRIRQKVDWYVRKGFTYADLWEEKCQVIPHKVCLVFEGQSFTFADMERNINRMAHFLLAHGIKKGDVVAVLMDSRPQFIFTWMALSKIGAVSALLNSSQRGVALLRSIKISTAKTIIYGSEMNEQLGAIIDEVAEAGIAVFCEGGGSPYAPNITEILLECPVTAPPRSVRAGLTMNDTWGFIFTSGTTGFPKASVIKHLRLFVIALGFTTVYGVTPSDRIYSSLPLFHTVGALIALGMMICTTGTLVLRRKFSAQTFIKDTMEHHCTVVLYSGELCRYLMAQKETPLDQTLKIRLAIGNGLRPDIWEAFQTRFNIPEIGEFYASTEGNVALGHIVRLDGLGRGAVGFMGPISRRVGGSVLVQLDREKEELVRDASGCCVQCKPGQTGEMLGKISGGQFSEFTGYFGNKEGTERKLARDVLKKGDLYYRTGDLMKMDSRGYIYFMDRIGDNYRWKSENISTSEVAEALSEFSEIQEVNVYGIQLPKQDGRVGMAAIVPKTNETIDMAALARHACRELPSYAVPLFIRVMPQMDVTDTWKYKKVDLRKEAINIHIVSDPIFILNQKIQEYEPLSEVKYREIMFGKARL